MYENALDWEHRTYVHSSTFSAIECEDAFAGAEIWTHVYELAGGRLDVVIDFFIASVAADREKIGAGRAYTVPGPGMGHRRRFQ